MAIQIQTADDWTGLRNAGLGTVVDPMVLRCGELFLKGSRGVADADTVWQLLSANLFAVGMFFDSLILNEKLPVFNYGDTFDMGLNFDQRVLTLINDYEDVFYDVDVQYHAYHEVKSAALRELRSAFEGPRRLEPTLITSILSELSAADYRWSPGLDPMETGELAPDEKQIAAFLLGGLIFTGYAQLIQGEHYVQPKRSRLLVALALQAKSAGYSLEERLFSDLKRRANVRCADLPWQPTFFPYLLSVSENPTDVLEHVVELRQSSEVADYRHWLRDVLDEWERDGLFDSGRRGREIKAVTDQIDRRLGTISSAPSVELKATLTTVLPSLNLTPTLQALWGWMLASLPGNRYRKLLTRAVVSDRNYALLDRRVRTVWTTQ